MVNIYESKGNELVASWLGGAEPGPQLLPAAYFGRSAINAIGGGYPVRKYGADLEDPLDVDVQQGPSSRRLLP